MRISERMRRNVTTVGKDEDLAVAVQLMGWRGVRHLPVVEDGRVVGMVTERDLLSSAGGDLQRRLLGTVGDVMREPAGVASEEMSLEEAARILATDPNNAIVVVEDGHVDGILTVTDLLGMIAPPTPPEHRVPIVEDVMTTDVELVRMDDPLLDAVSRMVKRDIRHLLVVDGLMHLVGVLSVRDVQAAIGDVLTQPGWNERRDRGVSLEVQDAMSVEPRTVGVDEPLDNLLSAMEDTDLGAVPVVDAEARLVGIVTYFDVVRFLATREAQRPK